MGQRALGCRHNPRVRYLDGFLVIVVQVAVERVDSARPRRLPSWGCLNFAIGDDGRGRRRARHRESISNPLFLLCSQAAISFSTLLMGGSSPAWASSSSQGSPLRLRDFVAHPLFSAQVLATSPQLSLRLSIIVIPSRDHSSKAFCPSKATTPPSGLSCAASSSLFVLYHLATFTWHHRSHFCS